MFCASQVVRCFEDNDIIHVNGKIDPKSDIDVINLELVFSDLDQVDKFTICIVLLSILLTLRAEWTLVLSLQELQIEKRLDKLKKGKAKDTQSKSKVNHTDSQFIG